MLCCVLCSYHLEVCTRSQDTLGAPQPWARAALSPSMPHCQVLSCQCLLSFAAHGTTMNCHLTLQSCILGDTQATCQLSSWHAAQRDILAPGNPELSLPTSQACVCLCPVFAMLSSCCLSASLHSFAACLRLCIQLLPVCVPAFNCCLSASLHSSVTCLHLCTGGESIDTSTVTTTPYVLHYTAEDALGNIAVPVSRTVSVYDPCTPQAYCTASGELLLLAVWTITHM